MYVYEGQALMPLLMTQQKSVQPSQQRAPPPHCEQPSHLYYLLMPTASARTQLIAHLKARIARYKVPKAVDFADALPRNGAGKVMKRVLREPFWAGVPRRVN